MQKSTKTLWPNTTDDPIISQATSNTQSCIVGIVGNTLTKMQMYNFPDYTL